MSKNLTYRPNLEPSRKYHTSGNVPSKAKVSTTTTNSNDKTTYEQVGESVGTLEHYQIVIPGAFEPLSQTIKKAIEFVYVCVDPEKINEDSKGQGETELEKKNPKPSKDPIKDAVLSKFQPSVIIRVKEPNIVDQVEYHYNNCLLEIAKHHSGIYKKALADHFITMTSLINESEGLSSSFATKEYIYAPSSYKNPNNKHVSDFIVRSQVVRDQNLRLSQKLFNNSETLNLMKACESSKELLKRYLKEKFEPNVDTESFFKSSSLDDSIALYQKKMQHNLYELYKYLNSSVIALEKNLKMYAKEAQAKAILIKEEGITL